MPAGERRVGQRRRDHLERQFEPVGLLGVDGEIEVVGLGAAREIDDARHELAQHAIARDRLEAGMQRRQLDRDAGPLGQRTIAALAPDRIDRARIGVEIARGVVRGARALPQHVEGITRRAIVRGPRERLGDVASEHEMRAQQPHRLAGRGAHRRQAEPADQARDDPLRGLMGLDDAGRQAERPGRGGDQERIRTHLVMRKIRRRELVLDQAVGGGVVGNPQQRLGQHHEGEALLGGQRIFMQEILDPADAAGARADRRDEAGRAGIDARLGRRLAPRLGEKARRQLLVGGRVGRAQQRQVGPARPRYASRLGVRGHSALRGGRGSAILRMAARSVQKMAPSGRVGNLREPRGRRGHHGHGDRLPCRFAACATHRLRFPTACSLLRPRPSHLGSALVRPLARGAPRPRTRCAARRW